MPFEPPPKVKGDWVSMSDMAKLGEAVVTSAGFLHDEPSNVFKGETVPRYVVQGKVKSTGDEIKISVPKGYSRDRFLEALDEYLKAHADETVDIKFVSVSGSRYVDVEQA